MALAGRPSTANPFFFFLAEKLGKSVGEIRNLPAQELIEWGAYYAARGQQDELRGMVNGRG